MAVSNWCLEPATNAPTHLKNRRQLTSVSFKTTGQLHDEALKLWTIKFGSWWEQVDLLGAAGTWWELRAPL